MKGNTIHINKLSIGYKTKKNEKIVAQDLTSTIRSGELTCLIGANGIGKSTLLRTLAGFQPPLSGDILIENKSINSYTHKDLSRLIGVVLTEKVDIQNMSVLELVSMGRTPHTSFWGKLTDEDWNIVNNAIHQVNITKLSKRPIQTLSDGERQKAMIAKALAQQTPVIILDEPTAFLDFPSKVEIMQLLNSLSKTMNKTIFLSTHDLELALQIADTIWIMNHKKELLVGSPDELADSGSIENIFQGKGVSFDPLHKLFKIDKQLIE